MFLNDLEFLWGLLLPRKPQLSEVAHGRHELVLYLLEALYQLKAHGPLTQHRSTAGEVVRLGGEVS